jgi:hypothetical protein
MQRIYRLAGGHYKIVFIWNSIVHHDSRFLGCWFRATSPCHSIYTNEKKLLKWQELSVDMELLML